MTGCAFLPAQLVIRALDDRHLLERELHAEVTRAIMIPSKASTISSSRSHRLRLLDLGEQRDAVPSSSMIFPARGRRRPADRTNDRAMMSNPVRSAQRRSALVLLGERAGALTATPGRLSPLLSEIIPPTSTFVITRGPSTSMTSEG